MLAIIVSSIEMINSENTLMATPTFDPKQLAQFEAFFETFMATLRNDHQGENAEHHCTAYPLHIVQTERLITGMDPAFASDFCAMDIDTNVYFSPVAAWEAITQLDEHDMVSGTDLEHDEPRMFELLKVLGITRFSEASEDNQWDLIELLDNVAAVTGYQTIWEFDSAHLTSDSAESKRKRLAARHGVDKVRIDVDSGYDSDEFTQIINALLSGLLAPAKA